MIIIEGEEQEIELEFRLIEQFNERQGLVIDILGNADDMGPIDE